MSDLKTVFTGLVQALGTIRRLGEDELQVTCTSGTYHFILQDLALGDSVAVDGVCLTVTQILPQGFLAAVSPETIRRTTLEKQLEAGYVNLEASLRVGSKLGGHFVTGHVDGIGCLQSAEETGNSWEMSFTVADPAIARYIVPKGSIAVNGVSLTVAECNTTGTWFKVAVIPHTYAETNLHYLQPDSWVNLEGDVLGKYVEKFLRFGSGQALEHTLNSASYNELSNDSEPVHSNSEMITPTFLTEHGYL
ncbi:riboflavin synthase [Trichocoleus sp. FACHB-591]|uniref:riboflavin synthase n=1 Tax=Trichocoleus sp. FACHB-591 TaxID=2692872 RepID=UPI0018EF6BCC|nr:riboflavin synthase [Trichocoleus sp. FACHB-591]